jgi:hypothetical protein
MINNIKEAFQTAHISNNSLSFPLEISSNIYKKAKSMLSNIRGEYFGKKDSGRFEFAFDPSDIVEKFLENDEWPKKNPYALFPTPRCIIDYAIEHTYAGALMWSGYEMVRILEPSAGRGDFIDEVAKKFKELGIRVQITCAEIDPVNIAILKSKGYSVIEGDFLNIDVESLDEFDLIITNPPFQRETYIHHVNHAQKFLCKHGKMLAVIPTKLFTSITKIGVELKHRVAASNIGEFADCIFEEGTFKNTEIETMIVSLSSVEVEISDMKSSVEYAAYLMCLCLNNINRVNSKINGCNTADALEQLMPYLTNAFIDEDPYAFLNDDVITAAKAKFSNTLQLNDKSTVNAKQFAIPANEEALDPIIKDVFNEIDFIQFEMSNVQVNIGDYKPINKVKHRGIAKVTRQPTNEYQMDMFSMA